jgi:hypothetical protein
LSSTGGVRRGSDSRERSSAGDRCAAVSFAILLYLSVVASSILRKNLRLLQEIALLCCESSASEQRRAVAL